MPTMASLPYGSCSAHIQASKGADSNIMKFYCTEHASNYGKNWEKFRPRPSRHTGTGYLSNFRPGVYYSRRLDDVDNPAMARLIAKNYHSVTELAFQPYKVSSSGKDPLPMSVYQAGSGFIRQKPITAPTSRAVQSVCIDTRMSNASADILPRYKPLLHKIQSKDAVELENSGYGPGFMTTETKERFKGQPSERMDTTMKTLGPNEETGFTHAYNVEPVTYHPGSPYKGDRPGYITDRPTGRSIMKTHFQPSEFLHGGEPLPTIPIGSERGTGFTAGTKARPVFVNRVMGDAYDKADDMPRAKLERTKKQDPTEYMNMTHPNNYTSLAKDTFLGQQRPDKTEADRLETTGVGFKELTGFSENNDRFVQTSDNPRRFITHYATRFPDPTPEDKEREGHCRGGVHLQKSDGFTKSTAVHSYGPDINTTATLRSLHPYVGRSIRARDSYFDDHTHDLKLHRSVTVA
ncbi:protein phosphatase 1 regulatory subunit 32 [Lingula anatina]|uniref:Protein phosphatase 1 regulatory subunit 32 n=1 Tax=Lingula anatina TaxID=7574 RepID=A0A1S3HJ15_LINAN|nr:protein phosphatase 1 regulatory subunit 32-like [Lingula anatina]XP_013421643.1 protein phosphatase 1 regulatory subunit 32 [Lingula anatina]|eukprot:XP_013385451.1 protein phosphatase 1 regulatory subunit 32-like [Lingula anatina]